MAASTQCPSPAPSVVRTAPGEGKTVALTFDDGPGPATPAILKILRRYNVRATFFDTGAHDKAYPATVAAVAGEGHLLANHTYEHQYPTQVRGGWSPRYLTQQLTATADVQEAVTGQRPCFFRPPGGFLPATVLPAAAKLWMTTVLWSVDTEDWKQPAVTSAAATNRIVAAAEAGIRQTHPVILMHTAKASHEPESQVSSNRSSDVAALPRILKFYLAHGYQFVGMDGVSGLPVQEYTSLTGSAVRGRQGAVLDVRLDGVSGPVPSAPLVWFSRSAGAVWWHAGGAVRTDRAGHVALPDAAASAEVLVRFAGDARHAAAEARVAVP